MARNAHAQADVGAGQGKEITRITGLVGQTEDWYRQHKLDEDVRNLSYYRGHFWNGDGHDGQGNDGKSYRAQQNEIFPIVDTVVSSLAMSTPSVEALDQRYWSTAVPTRSQDLNISGRRVASALNYWAEEDMMDKMAQELVLYTELFGMGVVKTSWSPVLGRPIWRTRLPWEWHCDPGARRPDEIAWAFERFTLHISDLRSRIESGGYLPLTKEIKADTYPRSLVDEKIPQQQELQLKEKGLKEYVGLVEFWDFREQVIYHIHPGSKQVLLKAQMPYGNPYEVLVFHDAVGRVRGIPDVSLLASNQRDINGLVSARREIVHRLPRRMLMDRALWNDEKDFERWKNARSWEPSLSDFPSDANINDKIWVSPEMPTTFDFNNHLEQLTTSIRWTTGLADYQRGEVANIRTAAEATMVRSSVEGRMHIRTTKVVRVVSSVFRQALKVWKWAAANPKASAIDMEAIARNTQGDSDATVLLNDLRQHTPKFRLLPFSPLMEDKQARRDQITQLLNVLGKPGPLSESINQRELARELVELYGLRPSIVGAQPAPMPVAPDPSMGPEGVPPEGGEAPPLTDVIQPSTQM